VVFWPFDVEREVSIPPGSLSWGKEEKVSKVEKSPALPKGGEPLPEHATLPGAMWKGKRVSRNTHSICLRKGGG